MQYPYHSSHSWGLSQERLMPVVHNAGMVSSPSDRRTPPSVRSLMAAPARCTELMPGDVASGQVGDVLRTLLGSCVSVILTDPRRTVGAMCHIVHVGTPNAANRRNTAYGDVAMQAMFDQLLRLGLPAQRCHAYVYGGGNMFPGIATGPLVGDRNADWALDFLAHHGIVVVGSSLGGASYRKVSWTVGRNEPVVEHVAMEQGGFQ